MVTEPDKATEGLEWGRGDTSDVEVSRWDLIRERYLQSLYVSAAVAWSDTRTKVGTVILSVYLAMAAIDVFGLWRAPKPSQAERYLVPFENMAYPLGTTQSGVDLFALIVDSTPFILLMVLAGGVWATVLAVLVGTITGYKGGTVDTVVTSISDFFMAIPGLPLVIVLAITFNPENPLLLGVVLTINYWAGLGRTIRSQVLTIREESYVEASRVMGVSTPRIIVKDVLPNIMPYVLVNFVLAARYTIFASVGLYFIGVLPYTGQNWGVTLTNAYNQGGLFTMQALHWLLVPIIAIVGLAFGLILLSQGMDRVFNPRVRTRMAGESDSIESTEEPETTGLP